MIESITIDNFAIINHLSIDFNENMTVLTGETGAGKSIIIDAIGQLIGHRTQTTFLGKYKDKAFIEGVFDITNNHVVKELLVNNDFEVDDDKLVISKSFVESGKSIIKLNYRSITLSLLKQIGGHLVDIHGQFETHALFNPENHIVLFDHFIGEAISKYKEDYLIQYNDYLHLKKQHKQMIEEEYNDEQLSFYIAKLEEIDQIDFENIDEDELEIEKKQLSNYELIHEKINAYKQYIDNSNNGAFTNINLALKQLSYLQEIDEYGQLYDKIYDLYYQMMDVHEEVCTNYNNLYFDEYRLQEIQNTITTLQRLKRRYGSSIESIIESREQLTSKIEAYENREEILEKLQNSIIEKEIEIQKVANQITKIRKEYAKTFEKEIESILTDMYLGNVKFIVDIETTSFKSTGQDYVQFLINTNIGHDVKPLHKVSSGGELSRIMLAIKIISIAHMPQRTIIFDEADTGVSGKVAESIGKKMRVLGRTNQVLCITHLAQVASFGDHHLHIYKEINNGIMDVIVSKLDESSSVSELAKMISGANVTDESTKHAYLLKKQNSV